MGKKPAGEEVLAIAARILMDEIEEEKVTNQLGTTFLPSHDGDDEVSGIYRRRATPQPMRLPSLFPVQSRRRA